MSITSDLTDIKTKANGLANSKVTNLAYDFTAYAANTVASPDNYDWSQHNNIPQQTTSAMKMTETQIDKGWRLRFPILNKYFFNAFFGRVSYNLNKLADFFYSAVSSLVSFLGAPNGLATLDASGRLPASQATETLLSYQGGWSAATNTPALSDGMVGAIKGDMYLCDSAGTVTFGTGNTQSFKTNDRVVYNGSQWRKWAGGTVASVCEILPDGAGNIDLTQQSDVTKILSGTVIGQLFYWGIGRNWVQCTGGEPYAFRGATQGDGIWVAFSIDQGLWWSTDGKSWTKSTTVEISSYGFRSAYYLNGIWIAGSDGHGIWWSVDGKTWTQGTGLTASNTVYDVDYNNGLFVAGSDTGVWWSTDGKAWTAGTAIGSGYFCNIKYINNVWFGCTFTGEWWSEDGKHWSRDNVPVNLEDMVYGNGVYVASGTGIYYTPPNTPWQPASTAAVQNLMFYSVEFANGLFVAGSLNNGLWYSTDGANWTQVTSGANLTFTCVKYANGIWLASSSNGGLFISTNGIDFTLILNVNTILNSPLINIGFFNGMFVIGTTAGLYYSDWTTI